MNEQLQLWQQFCDRYIKGNLIVPLFSANERVVDTKKYGANERLILKRSPEMESFVIEEVTKVLEDFENAEEVYEGLIYMMYKLKNGRIVPLYIGKSEKYGKSNGNLSANIKSIKTNKFYFCRWGDNYAYHIGDLSAVVCLGHPVTKAFPKYQRWADALFELYPSAKPILKEDVYFWIRAWKQGDVGIFREAGAISLTALEYQLISVAATVFPEYVLNQEGVNRRRKLF